MGTLLGRFAAVDSVWRKTVDKAMQNPNVMAVMAIDGLLKNFRECIELLELIQKGLNEYLETKP